MAITQIRFLFTDGAEEAVNGRLYRCLADRLAFERHYGVTLASTIPPELAALDPASFKDLPEDASPELVAEHRRRRAELLAKVAPISEEHMAFLCWRRWCAAKTNGSRTPFAEWMDTVAEIEFVSDEAGAGEVAGEADPPVPAPPPTASP